jgi:ribosomal protein L14E/L6E/L27E
VYAGGPSDAWNIDERQVNIGKSQVTHRVTIDLTYSAIKAIKPNVTTRDLIEKWSKSEEFGWPDEDSAGLMQWGTWHWIGPL